MSDLPHLRIEHTEEAVPYTSPGGGGGGEFKLPARDGGHVTRLSSELSQAMAEARERRKAAGVNEDGGGDVITVRGEPGFELKFDSLERRQSGIELLSVKQDGNVTIAQVYVPSGKYVKLIAVLDAYATKTVATSGLPRNRELVESISSIQLAALKDFWQEIQIPPPGANEVDWWEVWLRTGGETPAEVHKKFAASAQSEQLQVSEYFVHFPERVVTLVYGEWQRLGTSIDMMAMIAELRKAKEIATDYRDLPPRDQGLFTDDLAGRLQPPHANAPAVCILDIGVNREHPLLVAALNEADTQSIREEWGVAGGHDSHGTEMAGVALYGNLAEVLKGNGPVTLRHRLESVKLLPPSPLVNERKDYAPFTEEAVALAEIVAPDRKRAFCMAVTADDRDRGMPSAWSAAVDQLASAALDEPGDQRLFLISAGNMRDEFLRTGFKYHDDNCRAGGIEDPAQAWNAVTVGACTELVHITHPDFSGWQPVAPSGDLSPVSRTSQPWLDEGRCVWPLKPDIVMEGGNCVHNGGSLDLVDDLALLTTVLPPYTGKLFDTTHGTSPATALSSRMAATIWSMYPKLWPETVRGLLIHSAEWTPAMLQRYPGWTKGQVQECLRCYGYGVPNLQRALHSAENAATLLFEGSFQPFHKVGGKVRSNEMHIHTLPWPVEVLQGLGEVEVRMKTTLSYFVEPSPGRIGWTRKHRYSSHGLRFDVILPEEEPEAFRQRLSRDEWDDPELRPDNAAENRNWRVGKNGRSRGSIHSDWWTGTAAQLAACNQIAVYPVTGWWRERAYLGKFEKKARYSLLISIEAPGVETDIYTPITARTEVVTELDFA